MPAIPYSDTPVIDKPWDGPGTEAKIPNTADASTLRKYYAWVDPNGDPNTKAAYRFPHHEYPGGQANVRGVRNALARLPQSNVPTNDHSGVQSHLQKHLDKFNQSSSSSEDVDLDVIATVVRTEGRVWALRPDVLTSLAHLRGNVRIAGEHREIALARGSAGPRVAGGVATVPLKGILTPEVSLLAMLFGMGSGLSSFRSDLQSVVGDNDVSTIVLDIDSPGGLVDQIPETAAEIAAARAVKPIVAVANTQAASAAYWLAAQADEIVVTPSGEVGSIGVYQIHKDMSVALEKDGVKPTVISAGKYKVEGNPYEPLDDEAAGAIQTAVNDYYDMFVTGVAQGRGVSEDEVRNGYGEGRVLTAKRAVRAGLADRVDTLQSTVSRVASKSSSVHRNRQSSGSYEDHQYSQDERRRIADVLAG